MLTFIIFIHLNYHLRYAQCKYMRRVVLLSVLNIEALEYHIDFHVILYPRFCRALNLVEVHF